MNHNIVTHYQFAAFQIITNITNNNIKLFLTKSQQIFDIIKKIIMEYGKENISDVKPIKNEG
jgi:hypothetical protein